jgi:hypothetical protein
MDEKQPYRGGVAVWYFIGATSLFAGATIFGDDAGPMLRGIGIVLGLVVLIAGLFIMRKEMTGRK